MKRMRFSVLAIVSFVAVLISSVFTPGAFLSRALSIILCTVLSFNSTFCISLASSSERVSATESHKNLFLETPHSHKAIAEIPRIRTSEPPSSNLPESPINQTGGNSSVPITSNSSFAENTLERFQQFQGTLKNGDPVIPKKGSLFNSYAIQGQAGELVTITLESNQFDTYLIVLDSQGKKQIAENDNISQNNTNSAITIKFTKDDTYTVLVTSHDSTGRGQYTLIFRAPDNLHQIFSTTPEGCRIVLNSNKKNGKPSTESVEFIAKDKKSCGNSFITHFNPDLNSVQVDMSTGEKYVMTIPDLSPEQPNPEPLPEQPKPLIPDITIQEINPDGKTNTFKFNSSNHPEKLNITKIDSSGKTDITTFQIPDSWYSKFDMNPRIPSESSPSDPCESLRKDCHALETASNWISNLEVFSTVLDAWPIIGIPINAMLGFIDVGVSLTRIPCFILVGGYPPIPFVKAAEKLFRVSGKYTYNIIGNKFGEYGQRLIKNANEQLTNAQLTGNLARATIEKAGTIDVEGIKTLTQRAFEDKAGNLLDRVRDQIGLSGPCRKEPTGKLKQGMSHGDPHLITFDGLSYNFQTVGEFILVKSNDGYFEVQARQSPLSQSLSLNSAVAMKIGGTRIAFYSKDFPDSDTATPLRINGKPIAIQGDSLTLPNGGTIHKNGDTYIVKWPTGEMVTVNKFQLGDGSYLNISPFVFDGEPGRFSGLLGNLNGDSSDDQQIRGGGILTSRSTYGDLKQLLNSAGVRIPQLPFSLDAAEKLYFQQLYKDFGNSWRISQAESLFDYAPGKTTDSYTDRGFPDTYLSLKMLPADRIQKAQAECLARKVDPNLLAGCVFDVGFSGLSDFARIAAEVDNYRTIIKEILPGVDIPNIPTEICLPVVGCRKL